MKKILSFILALVLAVSLVSCGKDNKNTSSAKIIFCLDWTPNTNHTGVYVALAKNYYKDAGLDVTIVQPAENSAVQSCSAGQVQFTVDAQDTLAAAFASDTPMNVTAVAAIIQHNTSGIMSLKGQGMERPSGITNNTYLTLDSPIELAIMKNVVNNDGGDWSKVKVIPNNVTDEAQDIKANPNHAIWVFSGWGKVNADVNNVDTDFFLFNDINKIFDYYTPVIIANNDYLKDHPDEASKFMEATKRGYEFAAEYPEEAARILIDADETKSLNGCEKLVTESQKRLSKEYISDAKCWGYIEPARWNAFYDWLYEEKIIDKKLPAGTGFTNDYLK